LEDRELLAAIGEVVVNAAALDYAVAVLVATIEGHRDQSCEDYAVAIVKAGGGAMRALMMMTCAQLRGQGTSAERMARILTTSADKAITPKAVRDALKQWDHEHAGATPATRHDLIYLWRDAKAVLDDRHVIAHSLAVEDADADGQACLVIFHPGSGKETTLTTPAVLSHAHDIRIAYSRFHKAIAAQTSGSA